MLAAAESSACGDGGGLTATEAVSLFLAAAAFVVSIASLWLTSLRRPKVEVDRVESMRSPELLLDSWGNGMPVAHDIKLRIFVANSGASGTVVERFDVVDLVEVNDGKPLWSAVGHLSGPDVIDALPVALERDDARTFEVNRQLVWHEDLSWLPGGPGPAPIEELARRLGTLRSVSVTLTWTYRRPKLPRLRKRERVEARQTLQLDVASGRQQAIDHWRSTVGMGLFANLAEGRSGDPHND